MSGKLIIIDGPDGSGKGACIDYLKEWLPRDWFIFTREPGGTPEGVELRKKLMQEEMTADEEMGLFFEDRRLHFEKVIIPKTASGISVICDRSFSSTYAYQVVARQRPELEELFVSLCKEILCDENGVPKVESHIICLDVTPEEGLRRKAGSEDGICTKFDRKSLDFHQRVREGFKEFLRKFQGRFFKSYHIVDTEASDEDRVKLSVFQIIM